MHPYMYTNEFPKALNSKPDVVIIMLGTNDAREKLNDTEFVNSFNYLVQSFIDLEPQPHVYVMTPPPVYI
jgi:acyl-CoA thioesterase-1